MEIAALTPRTGTARLFKTSSSAAEALSVSYTGRDGRTFNLEIERKTTVETATYDSSGSLRKRGEGRAETRALRHQVTDLEHALRDAGEAVRGFRQLLHRMLKAADPAYGGRFADLDPWGPQEAGISVETGVITESLSISMDVVDPEYWSVENTAARLKDFAVALYGGGDRQEHLEKMFRAMEQGYGEARDALGGSLPDIARETIDMAKEMLSEWAVQSEAPTTASEPPLLDLVA